MSKLYPKSLSGKKHAGFTLIELLVVVLIIGILAAVAVPQYQKSVEKARVAQVVAVLKAVKEAEELHFLANGFYTDDVESLSIDWTCPQGWTCLLRRDAYGGAAVYDKVEAYRTDKKTLGVVYSFKSRADNTALADALYCWAKPSDAFAVSVCKSMGPDFKSDSSYVRHYIR